MNNAVEHEVFALVVGQGFPKVGTLVIASEAKQSPFVIWGLLRGKNRPSQ